MDLEFVRAQFDKGKAKNRNNMIPGTKVSGSGFLAQASLHIDSDILLGLQCLERSP